MTARGGDPGWAVGLSLAGLLALIGGALYAVPHLVAALPSGKQQVERELLNSPESRGISRVIKEAYPEDFDHITTALGDAVDRGTPPYLVAGLSAQLFRQAMMNHRNDLYSAPHDALAAYRAAEIEVIERLNELSAGDCAGYVVRGAVPPPEDSVLQDRVLAMNLEYWKSAAAGTRSPIAIESRKATTADFRAFHGALLGEGLSEEDIEEVDSGTINSLSQPEQCRIGVQFYKAMHHLPDETADRIYIRFTYGE